MSALRIPAPSALRINDALQVKRPCRRRRRKCTMTSWQEPYSCQQFSQTIRTEIYTYMLYLMRSCDVPSTTSRSVTRCRYTILMIALLFMCRCDRPEACCICSSLCLGLWHSCTGAAILDWGCVRARTRCAHPLGAPKAGLKRHTDDDTH